ncbi:unnamed protein product [Timema podura]|uniref:Uncharacterized protein n=1 Tax=Timema podura TaxID=61482 RepID=A0ABN7NDW5_TIMPD|nr:unnamed protein product [Timema podura]
MISKMRQIIILSFLCVVYSADLLNCYVLDYLDQWFSNWAPFSGYASISQGKVGKIKRDLWKAPILDSDRYLGSQRDVVVEFNRRHPGKSVTHSAVGKRLNKFRETRSTQDKQRSGRPSTGGARILTAQYFLSLCKRSHLNQYVSADRIRVTKTSRDKLPLVGKGTGSLIIIDSQLLQTAKVPADSMSLVGSELATSERPVHHSWRGSRLENNHSLGK